MTTVRVHLYDDLVARSNHREMLVDLHRADGGTTGADLVGFLEAALAPDAVPGQPRLAGQGVAEGGTPSALQQEISLVIIRNGKPITAGELAALEVDGLDEFHVGPRPRDASTLVLLAISIVAAVISGSLTSARLPRAASSEESQKRYRFARFSSAAVAGGVMPVPFGHRPRYGPKEIAAIPVEASDGSGTSKLRILYWLAPDEIEAIGGRTADFDRLAGETMTGLYFNDQPVANFPGTLVSGRMGTLGQTVMPGFTDTEALREVGVGGVELRNTSGVERTAAGASGEAFQFTTVGNVNAAVARVLLPQGLYQLGSSGQVDTRRVKYRWRWRLNTGPGAYSAWTVVTVERADQSEFFSSPRMEGLAAGGGAKVDIQLERVSVESASAAAVDKLVWDSVVEVLYSSLTYPGHAMLALELTAGEQLQGKPQVSVDLKGLKVGVWDGNSSTTNPTLVRQFSRNPIWQSVEVIRNARWGMGATYGGDAYTLDWPNTIEEALRADESIPRVIEPALGGGVRPRFCCDITLEEARDGIDWVRAICTSCWCTPSTAGNVWRFIADKPRATPIETFGDGDIARDDEGRGMARDSYRREYALGGVTRPNQMVAQYENALRESQPDTMAIPEAGTLWLGAPLNETARPETVRLDGVTDPDQVAAHLTYAIDRVRGLSRTIRFVTTKPVVVVQPGERFDRASGLVGWGVSGRVVASSPAGGGAGTVVLDRTVTLDVGASYQLQITHADNSIEVRAVTAAAGTYVGGAAGAAVAIGGAALAEPAAEGDGYALGKAGLVMKPFTCLAVRPADAAQLLWEIEGLEYNAAVYDRVVGNVVIPGYSGLGSIFTPPGVVLALQARESTVNGIHQVTLSWQQTPADAGITANFRIYRRRLGTSAWILVPGASVALRGAILEMGETDVGYQFVVVAVSQGGAALSPYDPRVEAIAVSLVFGLAADPPPPPANPLFTLTGGNTYTLSWDPVEGAVEYQVLARGYSPAGLANTWGEGPRDAVEIARAIDTELAGLELAPAQVCAFWIRSVGSNGRLSFTASPASVTAAVPAGESVKQNSLFDSGSTLTLSNCSWVSVGGVNRLRITDATLDAVLTTPEMDSGSLTLTELTLQPSLVNDADDPVISSNPFTLPSVACDQWGLYAGPPRTVAMIFPPWPASEVTWLFEVRTHDGTAWGDYAELRIGQSVRRMFRKWQLRLTMRRAHAPYRPALLSLRGVLTH